MQRTCLSAYTEANNASYPEFVNLSAEDDRVVITVRSPATLVNGVRICGQTCRPGNEHCNNYCNMASEKGPMQDAPMPHTFHNAGQTIAMSLSKADAVKLLYDALTALGEEQ